MTDLNLWILVALAVLGTASWRLLGVVIGDRIPKDSIWSSWINAVAYAMVSGVMMLIVVFPTGIVATSDLSWRLGALAVALLAMLITKNFVISISASVFTFVLLSIVMG